MHPMGAIGPSRDVGRRVDGSGGAGTRASYAIVGAWRWPRPTAVAGSAGLEAGRMK